MTWDATGHESSTVSLVLCRGGSNNCVNDPNAIVSKIPASSESYEWAVPCSLPVGVKSTSTGYGMLVIEDGTGVFQYSTQFSVLAGASCGSGSSSTTGSISTSTVKPGPSYTGVHNGTSPGGYTERPDGWDTTSTATATPTVTDAMGIPTQTLIPGLSGTGTSVVYSTATQPSASRPAATGVSGANKNAAGMLFLGAMGAAFLL